MSVHTKAISLVAVIAALSVNSPVSAQSYTKTAWGFDIKGMNFDVTPGNDFFKYANGSYIEKLKIPSDLSSYGSFNILHEQSLRQQRELLDRLRKGNLLASSDTGKLATFYTEFMDAKRINKRGTDPLNPYLKTIRNLKSKHEAAAHMGTVVSSLAYSPFLLGIEQSQSNPKHYMLVLDQGMSIGVTGGLGLPDQSYYFDQRFKDVRKAYVEYISKILSLAGWEYPEKSARAILDLETKIAHVQTPREQTRDPNLTFNPMKLDKLKKLSPKFDWDSFFKAAVGKSLKKKDLINVREPEAIKKMGEVIDETDLETLKSWMAFHYIDNAAEYLPDSFSSLSFMFHGKVLSGTRIQSPRWKRGVAAANSVMGWALGKVYVERFFPAASKAKIISLTEDIKLAFNHRLEQNQWMDATTKKRALYKLSHFLVQVGYPNKWRTYEKLDIQKNDLLGNVSRATAFNWQYQVDRLHAAVDRDEWDMSPQTVNAYNNPTMNEVVFPAAILQPPFFDPEGDWAVNLGGIGGVIGHEISHGFDDQGRHYTAHGQLKDWWSVQSSKNFTILADKLSKQYSSVSVFPGINVNGKMTLGEDIADLGGLNVALEAYNLKHLSDSRLNGFSGEQRVFLGWSQVWREKYRPEMLKKLVLSNEHAPAFARVNVPVRNIAEWYKAFKVSPKDKLYLEPNKRVEMW